MHHHAVAGRRSERGITLIEILVVVALIGLLVGIAVPNFVRVRRVARVTTAANNIYLGLMRSRQLAIRKGRPILVKINATASSMQFVACTDTNFNTPVPGAIPGPDSLTTMNCTGGDLPVGAAGSFTRQEGPFGVSGMLTITTANNQVSFGHPAASGSNYTAVPTNFPTPTGINWIEFEPSGKIFPNGNAPLAALDYSMLPRLPALASNPPPGGPEFYLAEMNAAANNANPQSHVYRKITLTSFGGTAVEIWQVNGTSGNWSGIR